MFKKLAFLALICLAFSQDIVFNKNKAIKDNGKVTFDATVQASKIVTQMGFGWNLEFRQYIRCS